MTTLTLVKLYKPGGPGSPERHHYDFVVDGVSLHQLTGADKLGLVGLLGWLDRHVDLRLLASLQLEQPTDVDGNRQSLFVCHMCADIGCGAITAEIAKDGDSFIWRDFRFEDNYDSEQSDSESYQSVGPCVFEAEQYRAALKEALGPRARKR